MTPQSQYDPGFAAFGGGATSSVLHPVVLAAMIILIPLICLLPRRWVVVPLLLGILLTPGGQNVYIGGVHLFVSRLLVLIGCGRVLLSKPSGRLFPATFVILDKLFVVWAFYRAAAVLLLFPDTGALVNQVGFLLDALGGYFLFRSLIQDEQDVERVVMAFAIVALVSAAEMVREQLTGQNLFGMLGGILATPDFREGKIRAQAAFGISIAAGTFGATAFPLFLWFWKRGASRVVAIAGAASSSIMVFASASSTPIMAWLGAILTVCIWPMRKQMRLIRWGIVLLLIVLQIGMKAPVWFVIAHIDIGGGSSWERANLLDTCIRHFGDWWLIGTRDNANWGWDMWDKCNQFVNEAETGGLVVLICFIAMFVFCFKRIGAARKAAEGNRSREWQVWLLGGMMFAQILAYMGIDYFDQSKFVWYALLAIIPAATMTVRSSIVKEPKPVSVGKPAYKVPFPGPTGVTTQERLAGTSVSRQLFE
jgi:hypothetical protein